MKGEFLAAKLPEEKIRSIYDFKASYYDLWALVSVTKAMKLGVELADIRNGERVLEVAIGTGLNLNKICRQNPSGFITGIDIAPKMLNKASRRVQKIGAQNVCLHKADARYLPYAPGSFDLVMNNYLFDILPEQVIPQIVSEFKRVLAPGGRLVLTHMTPGEKLQNLIYRFIYHVSPPILGGCRGIHAEPFLRAQGFNRLQRQFVSQCAFPSEVILAHV